MNWEAIGAVGELIGGLAVIATLIYLAVQLRQNTAMITAQTVQASVDATQRTLLVRAQDPGLRAILRKARGDETLSRDEFEVLAAYLQAVFMNFQARLQHNTRGVFDASVNESYELILTDYLEQPYVQRWWSYARALYGEAFCAHCDEIVAACDSAAPLVRWEEVVPRDESAAQRL